MQLNSSDLVKIYQACYGSMEEINVKNKTRKGLWMITYFSCGVTLESVNCS